MGIVTGPREVEARNFNSPWYSPSTMDGVIVSPCIELEGRPMTRKNKPGGGGQKTPVSITTVPSSGVTIRVAEGQRFSPALPGVALGRLEQGGLDCPGDM